jgi:hypothetical protein
MADTWTTLLDPRLGEPFNYTAEMHNAHFLPLSENILGRAVCLLIPECELQIVYIVDGKSTALVNRPQRNKKIRHWLREACSIATEEDCSLMLGCDTHEQATRYAKLAARWLPNHRRIALERMYKAETRTFKGLS